MTDERDPKLDAAYRALGAEEPPVAIDQAILAASRRAAQAHPAPLVAPTGRRAWFVPLAAAAVLALAVGVTLHMQLEQPGIDEISSQTESAREAPAARAPATTKPPAGAPALPDLARAETVAPKAIAESRPREQAERRDSATASRKDPAPVEAPVLEQAPVAATAPAAPAAPAAAEALERRRDASRSAEAVGSVAGARQMQDRAAPALAKSMADTPERELERVAELRKQGLHDEADKALAEFRKRHPDFKIPPAMLERVERR